MTAITLNLLVEEQLAQKAQARDPFKVALAIGLGLCLVCVVLGTALGHFAGRKKAQADALQTKLTALSSISVDGGADTKSVKSQADDIIAINHARQLYAPQLALIKDVVPEAIQIERIGFTVSTETAAPAASSDAGKEGGKSKARAARSVNVQRLTLQLDGKAVGSRPEIEVDQFLQTMSAHQVLSTQISEVKLRSIARNAPASEKRAAELPSASFVIQCQYKDRK